MEVSGRKETLIKDRDQDEILCQPCQGEGEEVPAEGYCENCNEYFCTSCLRVHRKMAMTKNHVIKSKGEMPRASVQTDPCIEPCDIHKTEIVKYYCCQHESVGCGDCMVIDHKACKVELVSDVTEKCGNSVDIKKIKQKIEEIETRVSSVKQEMKENLKAATGMKSKIVDEIKLFRKELNTYLDQAEAELLTEVEQLNAKDVALQKDQLKKCDTIEIELKQFKQKMDQNADKINQLFVTVKQAQKRLKTYQESVKSISSATVINSYTFEPSNESNALKVSQSPIGKLSVVTKRCDIKEEKRMVETKAQFLKTLNAQAINGSLCCISGMAMLSSNEILLADLCRSLKILNVQENKIVSKYTPVGAPWDVTVINTDTSAATLPDKGTLLFVNTKGGLSESHTIKVKKWCRGIDYRNDLIAVSFTSQPAAIEILNLKGEILHHSDFPVISAHFPRYVTFCDNGKTIFLSDEQHGIVQKRSVEGQLKATTTFKHFKGPAGLVVTRDGTVVVCDKDDDKLSMIVPTTGKVLPLVVKHVDNPMSVLICEESNKMYVSEDTNGCIKVFDLM